MRAVRREHRRVWGRGCSRALVVLVASMLGALAGVAHADRVEEARAMVRRTAVRRRPAVGLDDAPSAPEPRERHRERVPRRHHERTAAQVYAGGGRCRR